MPTITRQVSSLDHQSIITIVPRLIGQKTILENFLRLVKKHFQPDYAKTIEELFACILEHLISSKASVLDVEYLNSYLLDEFEGDLKRELYYAQYFIQHCDNAGKFEAESGQLNKHFLPEYSGYQVMLDGILIFQGIKFFRVRARGAFDPYLIGATNETIDRFSRNSLKSKQLGYILKVFISIDQTDCTFQLEDEVETINFDLIKGKDGFKYQHEIAIANALISLKKAQRALSSGSEIDSGALTILKCVEKATTVDDVESYLKSYTDRHSYIRSAIHRLKMEIILDAAKMIEEGREVPKFLLNSLQLFSIIVINTMHIYGIKITHDSKFAKELIAQINAMRDVSDLCSDKVTRSNITKKGREESYQQKHMELVLAMGGYIDSEKLLGKTLSYLSNAIEAFQDTLFVSIVDAQAAKIIEIFAKALNASNTLLTGETLNIFSSYLRRILSIRKQNWAAQKLELTTKHCHSLTELPEGMMECIKDVQEERNQPTRNWLSNPERKQEKVTVGASSSSRKKHSKKSSKKLAR
jgi:hypothetical protein